MIKTVDIEYIKSLSYNFTYYVMKWQTLISRSICQIPLRNYRGYRFYNHMSFGLPKWTHCLNPIRYHDVFIKNIYCYQPLLIVIQFIGIYDHFRILPIDRSFLLILIQTQYPLKVKSLCNIVIRWIMTIDSLTLWLTIDFVQCTSHTLVYSPYEI